MTEPITSLHASQAQQALADHGEKDAAALDREAQQLVTQAAEKVQRAALIRLGVQLAAIWARPSKLDAS